MRHRIVLCGFSEFEHRAMLFSFLHPAEADGSGYDVVATLDAADYAVVDADSTAAIDGVVQSGRVADAVFIGASAPLGALSHLQRPIDPTRILRAVNELRVMHEMEAPDGTAAPAVSSFADFVMAPSLPAASVALCAPAPRGAAARAEPAWWTEAPSLAAAQARPAHAPMPSEPVSLSGPYLDDLDTLSDAPITLIDPVCLDEPPSPTRTSRLVVTDPPSTPFESLEPLEPLEALEVPGAAALPSAPLPQPASAPSAAQTAKAAARAAARRARLAHDHAQKLAQQISRDVLVLDADVDASAVLGELLHRFGFEVHAVRSLEAALMALSERPFVAVFLDTPLEGAGLAMVQRILKPTAEPGQVAPAVVLVRESLAPTDRVRAALAGVGEPMLKPVSRGSVARALEGLGVALPGDARRI